ncbi:MAG: hypothetical protein M3Q23_17305 [Actinomycetota bacterium]|nr:hypothetical protein [Actinomycetota bacterium]
MGREITRRQALARVGAAALGVEAVLAAGAAPASASDLTVRGAWLITPKTQSSPAGFQAVAAFAAGGVFITIGSDESGTGIGEWTSPAPGGFAFTYLNFHFASDGSLNNTVKVRAKGTFKAKTLSGHATLTAVDPNGDPLFAPRHFTFTGKRIAVEAP